MMNINNKTIVLTGANGGIGAAIAQVLADNGARLLLSGRDELALQQLVNTLGGEKHALVCADISTAAGRKTLVAKAQGMAADILINNAGANQLALLGSMSDTEIDHLLNINLIAPMLLCRDFISVLHARPEALIINIGSILGSIGQAGSSVYCASKAGLRGFTESLRRELGDSPISVVYIAPRATDTPLNSDTMRALNTELGTATDSVEIVAQAVVCAIKKPQRGYRYIGWPERFFVRLNYLFPALVDHALFKQLPIIRRYANI